MHIDQLLEVLNSEDEDHRLEAKSSKELGKSVMETICAFSNGPEVGVGTIVLGVEEDKTGGGHYRICGVADPDKLQKDLSSNCASQFNQSIRPIVVVEPTPEGNVVLVRVKELEDSQKLGLIFLREGGSTLNNSEYCQLTGKNTKEATQELRDMVQKGLLNKKGSGRGTSYQITPNVENLVKQPIAPPLTPNTDQPRGVSPMPEKDPTMVDNPSAMVDNQSAMVDNPLTMVDKKDGHRLGLLQEIPEDIAFLITRIGKRVKPEVTSELILRLCNLRAYSTAELSTLLNKREVYLRSDFLRPLLREGLINYTMPSNPRHPNQAYRTTEKGIKSIDEL